MASAVTTVASSMALGFRKMLRSTFNADVDQKERGGKFGEGLGLLMQAGVLCTL